MYELRGGSGGAIREASRGGVDLGARPHCAGGGGGAHPVHVVALRDGQLALLFVARIQDPLEGPPQALQRARRNHACITPRPMIRSGHIGGSDYICNGSRAQPPLHAARPIRTRRMVANMHQAASLQSLKGD
eukprot:698695-Prorocentrum_minimum.AAC.1